MIADKKIRKIYLSTIIIASLLLHPYLSFAEGLDPYSFDQSRNLQPVFQENFLPPVLAFKKPRPLPNAAPSTPMVVTDEDGNVFLYQDGKLLLKVDDRGNKTYYIGGLARYEKDDQDYLTRTYEYSGAWATIKNEFGEFIGYREFGLGGLLLKEYDEKKRLTKSYEYEGRLIKMIVDGLTNSKTLFNERGKPEKEINFHGATIATYYYQDNGRLSSKVDLYGNKTTYDHTGREQFTYDFEGNVIETYEWTSRNSYKVTDRYSNTTYVVRDKPQYVTRYDGLVTKTYNWQGTKLISSTDTLAEEITYYENGRPTEIRYHGLLVGLWEYDEETGVLISKTYRYEGTTYYDHGREGVTIKDPDFDLESFTRDYKPPLHDEIAKIILKYKDSSQSIMPDVEALLEEMRNKKIPDASPNPI